MLPSDAARRASSTVRSWNARLCARTTASSTCAWGFRLFRESVSDMLGKVRGSLAAAVLGAGPVPDALRP